MNLHKFGKRYSLNGSTEELRAIAKRMLEVCDSADEAVARVMAVQAERGDSRPHGGHTLDFGLDEVLVDMEVE